MLEVSLPPFIFRPFSFFFGGKKIPELMKGLGRGVKEFKDASKGEGSDVPEKPENQ